MAVYRNNELYVVTLTFGEAMNVVAALEGDGATYSIREV